MTEISKNRKFSHYFGIIAVLGIVFVVNSWIIRRSNWFTFDDFTFLNKSMFDTYESIFSWLPRTRYNDRPIGWMLIKFLFGFFKLDPVGYHVVYLLIHLLNTFLIWRIALKISIDIGIQNKYLFATLSAAFFGLWTKSLMSVQWISAIFDLLGCLFFLLIINLYLDNRNETRYKTFNFFLMLLLFYLGLRTKEMIILTPACLFIYEVLTMILQWSNDPKKRSAIFSIKSILIRFRSILILGLLMVGYFGYLFFVLPGGGTVDVTSPYYLSFSPRVLLLNAAKYISLYFEYIDHGFVFYRMTPASIAGLVITGMILLLAVVLLFWRKNPWLLAGGLMAFIMLAPVLPMKNMQHILYLYIPGTLIAMVFGGISTFIIDRLTSAKMRIIASSGVVAALILLSFTPGMVNFRKMWLEYCMKDRVAMTDIAGFNKPEQKTTVYVVCESEAYNAFFYGPGFVNTVVFNDNSIQTKTVLLKLPLENEMQKPYVIWEYDEKTGHVREMKQS